MCWINTIGAGKPAGSWVSTRCSATGPPVEVPIATSLYGLRLGAGECVAAVAAARAGVAVRAGAVPAKLLAGAWLLAGAGAAAGAGLE